jgi:hypothetical protein
MITSKETVTPLHRMGAVLHYLDNQPPSAVWVDAADVRRLLVGDLERPAFVAASAAEVRWLRGVRLAAEVATYAASPEHQRSALHSLRNQLAAEPKAVV